MNKTLVKNTTVVLALLCLSWLVADTACAHRVNVFAWVEGDNIHGQSKFSGGKKVKSGRIVVMDSQGSELYTGLTNPQGEFSFKVPQSSDLRIIVNAGQGHQGEWTLRAAEIGAVPLRTPSSTTAAISNQSPSGKTGRPISAGVNMTSPNPDVNRDELEAIVETVVDRKLEPITRILIDMQDEKPGFKDILAGVGYIMGLVGIAAYLNSRKKKA